MPRKKPETGENSPHSMARPKKTGTASKSRTEGRKKASGRGKGAAEQKAAPAVILGDGGADDDGGTAKHPGGRPTKYRPEFAEQARKLCRLGATDLDVANFFEVAVSTIYAWKITQPEFSDAIKRGKEVADDLVSERLFARATGYSHDAVKIFLPRGTREPVYARYVEHHAPDTTAAIFWLKNRRPDQWRDRQELTGKDGSPLIPVLEVVHTDGRTQVAMP